MCRVEQICSASRDNYTENYRSQKLSLNNFLIPHILKQMPSELLDDKEKDIIQVNEAFLKNFIGFAKEKLKQEPTYEVNLDKTRASMRGFFAKLQQGNKLAEPNGLSTSNENPENQVGTNTDYRA